MNLEENFQKILEFEKNIETVWISN